MTSTISPTIDLSKDFAIYWLMKDYDKQYEPEFNKDNWIRFHHSSEGGMNAIKESLKLIGDGEITTNGNSKAMYKEMLKDNTLILVVHACLCSTSRGGLMKGYLYEIGVYKNNPKTQHVGGGYGASGITYVDHTRLLSYDDYDIIHYNRNIISKVCEHIKQYAIEKF